MTQHTTSLGAQRLRPASLAGKAYRKTKWRAANARRQGCPALPGLARAILLFVIGFGLLTALVFIPPTSPTANAHSRYFTQNSQNSLALEPGKSIEGELKAGETHTYALPLVTGQYVRIDVEQRGVGILLTLLTPNREKIFEFVAITPGGSGKQIACLVAEQTGSYYVQIREAYGGSTHLRYAVQVSQPRAATAHDRERFAAQKIYGGLPIPRPTGAEAARTSIKKLEAALLISQKIGDQELEALLLREIGWRYSFDLNDEVNAIPRFERALQLRRQLGHKYDQAVELSSLGYSHYMLGKVEQAREFYQQSRPIFQEIGDRVNEGIVLLRLAMSFFRDSLKSAIHYHLQAEPLLRGVGGETETQQQYEMAIVWLFLGEPQNSFAASHRALSIAEHQSFLKGVKGNALLNLSRTHQAVGEYQQALDALYHALAIFKALDYREAEARATIVLGLQYVELGEIQRGIEFHQQCVELHRQINYEVRGLRCQAELVPAYYQLGQYQTARDYALSILPLTRKYQDKMSEGRVLLGLGQAYQALREYRKAGECFEQATALLREMQFPVGEAQALHANGQAQAAQRNFPQALELYRQALALAQTINNPLVEAQSLTGLAHVERELGNLAAASTINEAALNIVESVRSRIVSPALRASFLATRQSAYANYLALLMQQHRQEPRAGHATQALQMSERARARSLVEVLTEAPARIRQGVDPALLNRERELRQKLYAKSAAQQRVAGQTTEQAATFSREIVALTVELEQIDSQIRRQSPRYAALTQPQPLGIAEIQKEVITDNDTLLLEYALGEEQSYLWTISAGSFNTYELPKGKVIEQASQRVYDLLTARNQSPKFETPEERAARIKKADAEFPAAAAELSRMILAPIAAELRVRRPKQLLIVADGKLQYVPFAALPMPTTEGQRDRGTERKRASRSIPPSLRPSVSPSPNRSVPLIANYEIVNLPSASTLAVLRRELKGRTPAAKTVAVFADPVFEADDERLPKEVRERLARETQTPAKDKAAEAALATDELTRAIRDVGLDGERGGLTRLRFSRDEANAILQLAPEAGRFSALDFDANQEAATKPEISQYRYVHFATHGLVDNQTPELSGLALSQLDAEGRPRDGYLRMVEIYNLNLPAELVVLSACKTGLGKEVRGEGLMSLTRGFMYAGAARVLVSLWDVNDKSTAGLMSELRAAQLKLLKGREFAAPFYWAAFVQHGEPR